MMVNVGDGHFEESCAGRRTSTAQRMAMTQVIYDSTSRNASVVQQIPTNAVASYAGDGYNHWHVNEMMRYDTWGAGGTFRGANRFCFLNSDPWATTLPGYNDSVYRGWMLQHEPIDSQQSDGNQRGLG